MELSVRPRAYQLPSYSLTGDLIAFLRCGLQYRYSKIGRLPPSRPVQLWFGEFIHGVLEEAYRRYDEMRTEGETALPPWESALIGEILDLIDKRLAARGLVAWDPELRTLGYNRAEVAIQQLGPHLFPLIAQAEVRLTGTRLLAALPKKLQSRLADRYEMVGIVDVLTEVQLSNPDYSSNQLLQLILENLPGTLPEEFEIIVDYKGMRRPPREGPRKKKSLWTQYEWQVLTYSDLRAHQSGSKPVVAGILLYVNELFPTSTDIEALKKEIFAGTTDIMPEAGSMDETSIKRWSKKKPIPALSWEYRLRRAVRLVPVTEARIASAVKGFDGVVKEIETCVAKEAQGGSVLKSWSRNPNEKSTCVVCDSRTFCPDYQRHYAAAQGERYPKLPGVKK